MNEVVSVGIVQHDIVAGEPSATAALVEPLVATAADSGADLVVLSEMWSTGFRVDPDAVAEGEAGYSVSRMVDFAQQYGVTVIGSLPIRDNEAVYNRALVVDANGIAARYDKQFLFSFAHEDLYYRAGDRSCVVTVGSLHIGLSICYDLRFAPEIWDIGPEIELLVIPANWPDARRRHWEALLIARAIENQIYVIGANRVGELDGLFFSGGSCCVDPWGEAEMLPDGPGVRVVEIRASAVSDARSRFAVLKDRRR